MAKKQTKTTVQNNPNKAKVNPVVNPMTAGPFYSGSFWKNYWVHAMILMFMAAGLYFQCIPYDYVLDDQLVITDNAFTKKGVSGIKEIMTTESFTGYFGEQKNLVMGNRYRPLSIVTFAMEYEIAGGLNSKLSHIINILLYGLTGILLFQVLLLLFRNFPQTVKWISIPFLAALFFVAHPIHTEAVANIKGRDEIMSMLFSLAALYGSLRFMDNKSTYWLITSAISYFLALLSKENAITFLAVIPLSIYFFSQVDYKRLTFLMGTLLLTTIGYLVLRFNTAGVPDFNQQINDLMNNPFLGMTGAEKFGSTMVTLGKYVLLLIFPHPLSHDYYPYAIPKVTLLNVWAFLSFALYIGMIWIALKNFGKKSVVSYAILFYLTTLTIVSNLVINLGTFMNERFIFMASAGFCILLAYLILEKLPVYLHKSTLPIWILSGLLIAGYSVKTWLRVPDWKDTMSLNESAVKVSPNSARANSFMSTALFEKFKVTDDFETKKYLLSEAGKYADKAIKIVPDYQNANLMKVGVISENFKINYNINEYIKEMTPVILRRPDITFIKEFSDWINDRNSNQTELFNFYVDVGTKLLQYPDVRGKWAQQYLEYAYKFNPRNKKMLEALANAYDLNGNVQDANRLRMEAQNAN
ncbi:MAG: hypothetical protein IPM42_17095 [Saprospiraceae bacterium]|nr:hypothetical protein [Saprospiraceae bacterium]